ncbi:MAG: hypothetical protein KDD61_10820, partial [Bdellovibrionales bacterium]|nr:hypothetical protein [Bdellovibrionales bacterium]
MNEILIAATMAFSVGLMSVIIARKVYQTLQKAEAKKDAERLIREAEENKASLMQETEESVALYEKQLFKRSEKEIQKIQANADKIEKIVRQRESEFQSQIDKRYNKYSQSMVIHRKQADQLALKQRRLDQRIEQVQQIQQNYIDRLLDKTNLSKESVLEKLNKELTNKARIESQKTVQLIDEETQLNAD